METGGSERSVVVCVVNLVGLRLLLATTDTEYFAGELGLLQLLHLLLIEHGLELGKRRWRFLMHLLDLRDG